MVRTELSSVAAALPSYVRARILGAAASALEKDAEAFAHFIVMDAGHPLKEARREVAIAVDFVREAAEELLRVRSEIIPLEFGAETDGLRVVVRRGPGKPALLRASRSCPLAFAARWAAPAIAAGIPFIFAPTSSATKTIREFVELLTAAGWPPQASWIFHADMEALIEEEYFIPPDSGTEGGNAGVFIGADADLPWAAARCAMSTSMYIHTAYQKSGRR